MADIPAYSVAQAQQNADQSRRIAGLIFRGQATQKVNDPNAKYDPNIPDPAHVQGYGGYVDANGKWIGKTAPQIDQVTDRGPNVINMLGDAASRPNTQLNPNSNRHLNYAGDQALNMARGGAGQTFGLNQSRDAAADAAAAAGGIGTAGAANAASQAAQLGQTGQDLGAVRASALGMGPSAAEHLARSQLDSNIRAQSSLAATARGGNIASAMRGAQNAGQNMMLQSQQQMAAQRAQEQMQAKGF
jgi:hypothetical protein